MVNAFLSTPNRNEKFTVLGASGFIGSHLVRYLECCGHQYRAPSRDEQLGRGSLGHVIYCIGLTADFRERPLATVEAHVCVLRSILSNARFESLTYLSSTRVYQGASGTKETADLKVNPNESSDLYNLSKLMGESLCLHSRHRPVRAVRLSNVVGVRTDNDTFIDQLLDEGARTGHICLRSSLDSGKDYIYIDDVVRAVTDIAASGAQGVINVASGETVTNRHIITTLSSRLNYSFEVCEATTAIPTPAVDIARLQSEFGIFPRQFDDYFPIFIDNYLRDRSAR